MHNRIDFCPEGTGGELPNVSYVLAELHSISISQIVARRDDFFNHGWTRMKTGSLLSVFIRGWIRGEEGEQNSATLSAYDRPRPLSELRRQLVV
jgi:hypothetical protein